MYHDTMGVKAQEYTIASVTKKDTNVLRAIDGLRNELFVESQSMRDDFRNINSRCQDDMNRKLNDILSISEMEFDRLIRG